MEPRDRLHGVARFNGCRMIATDGAIGRITDMYFDEEKWVIRYLVVNTGDWLQRRKVLISPYAVRFIDLPSQMVILNLTRRQVAGSPAVGDSAVPSRQLEEAYCRYYGYPEYWPYATNWPMGAMPVVSSELRVRPPAPLRVSGADAASQPEWLGKLHSCRSVGGFQVEARDGMLGSVEDLLFDEETWAVRHLLVATVKWLPGRRIRLAPEWLRRVSWRDRRLITDLNREDLRGR
jgi:uncharacterized protein YrrD